jgi:hypothetical protein
MAVGIVHGRWTNRWGYRADIVSAGARLEQLPLVIGDWSANANVPLDPPTARLLQCTGTVNRVYVNSKTGDRVSIAVLMGPSGPISVHTPEVCYSSRDYHVAQDRVTWKVGEGDNLKDEFWELRMVGNDATPLRVLYGWTNEKQWEATANPRFAYGGSQYVYKLQLAGPFPGEDQKRDVCREFLAEFLPILRKYMIDCQ